MNFQPIKAVDLEVILGSAFESFWHLSVRREAGKEVTFSL
jgi:hypothetical protein